MKAITRGLIWASALILLALGNVFGLVDDKTANILFVLFPILAILPRHACRCLSIGKRAA